jgi:hypothetical protein
MEDEELDQPRPRRRRARGPQGAVAAAGERVTRRLAIGALVLALVAVGLTAWRFVGQGTGSCQSTAWSASPAARDLPTGWTISATQYLSDQLSATLAGPVPADQTSSQAVIYVTVTCYAEDAAGAVTHAQTAARAAGLQVATRTDLGDQGDTVTAPGGATFIEFRHASVVTYVAASGDAAAADVDAVASAFDRALGGDGSATALGSAAPSSTGPEPSDGSTASPGASAESTPAASAAAPELEAALPTTVAGTTLTVSSAVGSTVLGTDPGSRAIIAALREAGASADSFRAAQAYDASGTMDLSITAFRVEGMTSADLQKIVLGAWLSATGTGVTTSTTSIGGRTVTTVDYGDGGVTPYVTSSGDIVLLIETSDATLAAQAVAALPGG